MKMMKKESEVENLIHRTDWALVMEVCKIAARKPFDESKFKRLGGYLLLADQAQLLARIAFIATGIRPSLRRLQGATVARDGSWFCEAFSEIYDAAERAL
jgi:hypothetical protein